MNSVDKLTFWVFATEGGDDSAAWKLLVAQFATKGVDLTTAMY